MKHICVPFFALLLFFSCSEVSNDKSVPVTNWQVFYSQTEDIDEVIDSERWVNVDLNESISLPYTPKNSYQYIWLKGDFFQDGSSQNLAGITFKYISLVHRVYINNNMIGELDIREVRDIGAPRDYYIPFYLIKSGLNHVYLRVGIYDHWKIEVDKNIALEDSSSFKKTIITHNVISEVIPLSVLTILIGTFFSFLLKSFNDKWNKEYLLLAIRLFLLIICFLTFYSPIPIFKVNIIIAIWSGVIPLFGICMLTYPQIVFSIYFERLNKAITPLLISISILVYFLKIGDLNTPLYISSLLLSAGLSIITIIYILTKIIRNRDKNYKLVLIVTDSSILILNIIIVIYYLFFGEYILDPSFIVIISSLLLTILYSIYFARRESINKNKILSLTLKLKEIEIKSKESKKYNISPQLEEKLDKIISFIKQDYFKIITREDLAETVGVSPNYLSSLFNIYTGKKINDFINDIRLENAARRVIDSKSSITDIAFSSGFESLTTFNRLFKKKYNISPNEYRKKQ